MLKLHNLIASTVRIFDSPMHTYPLLFNCLFLIIKLMKNTKIINVNITNCNYMELDNYSIYSEKNAYKSFKNSNEIRSL